MQSATATARLAYSPDLGAGSSFPERHLDDDKSPFSGIEPEPYPGDRPVFGSSLAPLPAPAWPSQSRPFPHHLHHHHHVHSHSPLIDTNTIPSQFPQQTPTLQVSHPEWPSFQDQQQQQQQQQHQPQGNHLFWHPAHPAEAPTTTFEDDSDSIQSTANNDSPEEFSPSVPTPLPSSASSASAAKKPRRQSSHRVAKPTTTAAAKARAPTPTLNTQYSRADRPYIPDFDYNTDWLDPADLSAAFLPLPGPGPGPGGYDASTPTPAPAPLAVPLPGSGPGVGVVGEIEITYRDSSSSSKVDSKRIAHKLSEKTRRNRLTIAIREIQKLLPAEGEEGEDGDGEGLGEGREASSSKDYVVRPGVPSSKLDVVEMAVGFIKDLKERNREMKGRLKRAEGELAGCTCGRGRGGGMEGEG